MLRPLMWLLVPPSIVLTMPTLLRLNHQEVKNRIQRRHALEHPDIVESLIPEAEEDLPKEDWLFAQADQLMAAGFDPLTNILTASIYYLCRHEHAMHRLVTEIRGTFAHYENITAEELQTCKYLDAVLDECMRIHTNAAFGLPRVSPGATVDGHYIPQGVSLKAHRITQQFAIPRADSRGSSSSVLYKQLTTPRRMTTGFSISPTSSTPSASYQPRIPCTKRDSQRIARTPSCPFQPVLVVALARHRHGRKCALFWPNYSGHTMRK